MSERVASSSLIWLGCALAVFAWASSTACTPEEQPGERPGRGIDAVNPAASGRAVPAPAPSTAGARPARARDSSPRASSSIGGAPAASAAPAEPSGPPRELSEELRVMMGQPVGCLVGVAPAPNVTVSVSTIVDAHGNVLRATANGPLSAEGLACMQARAARVHFREPVPGAPVHVTAQIAFRMTRPGTEATSTLIGESPTLPPGAVDPMGGSAVPIAPRAGRAVEARPGTSVDPAPGVSIMGPSGTPIGR